MTYPGTRAHTACQRRQPHVIGLTGPIASGKSSVAQVLQELGALVIDADDVYAALMRPGMPLLDDVASRFGPGVLRANGDLDRVALAEIVFNDREALADLDRITHPAVVAEVRRRIERADMPVVVVEAIKLTQSGLLDDVDSLWLVSAEPELRVSRVAERSSISREAAQSRVDAASDPLPAGVRPDVTIENSGDWSLTRRAVHEAWHALLKNICKSSAGSEQEELR